MSLYLENKEKACLPSSKRREPSFSIRVSSDYTNMTDKMIPGEIVKVRVLPDAFNAMFHCCSTFFLHEHDGLVM